jgi:hypothetical protein
VRRHTYPAEQRLQNPASVLHDFYCYVTVFLEPRDIVDKLAVAFQQAGNYVWQRYRRCRILLDIVNFRCDLDLEIIEVPQPILRRCADSSLFDRVSDPAGRWNNASRLLPSLVRSCRSVLDRQEIARLRGCFWPTGEVREKEERWSA